jgi:hypothetical protein
VRILFNPSGTHQIDDSLKIRLDFIPDIGEKSYTQPRVLKHAPCLSTFIRIDENTTRPQLVQFINDVYTPRVLATIDDAMCKGNSAHLINPYMRNKTALSTTKGRTFDAKIKADIDARLSSLSITRVVDEVIDVVHPQSIDIGYGADYGETSYNFNVTIVYRGNQANANGEIQTVEMYFNTDATGVEVAMFYEGEAAFLTTRSNTLIGSVVSGSKQTFTGLTLKVRTGDYIGYYCTAGGLGSSGDAGYGTFYIVGDAIPCTNVGFNNDAASQPRLYGTGIETAEPLRLYKGPTSKRTYRLRTL